MQGVETLLEICTHDCTVNMDAVCSNKSNCWRCSWTSCCGFINSASGVIPREIGATGMGMGMGILSGWWRGYFQLLSLCIQV